MNFSGNCWISKDPKTKKPQLLHAKTLDGRNCVKGKIFWKDGGIRDGKSTYADMRFIAFDEMADFITTNGEKELELKNCLVTKQGKDKSLKTGKEFSCLEVVILGARVCNKNEPVKSFQEVDY